MSQVNAIAIFQSGPPVAHSRAGIDMNVATAQTVTNVAVITTRSTESRTTQMLSRTRRVAGPGAGTPPRRTVWRPRRDLPMAEVIPIRARMAAIASPKAPEPDALARANERALDAEIRLKAENAARVAVEQRLAAELAARAISEASAQRERDARVSAEALLAAATARVAELESRPAPEPVQIPVHTIERVTQPESGGFARLERLIAGLMPQRKAQPQLSHFKILRDPMGKMDTVVPVMKEGADGV